MTPSNESLAVLFARDRPLPEIAAQSGLTEKALRVIAAAPFFQSLVARARVALPPPGGLDPKADFERLFPLAVDTYEDAMRERGTSEKAMTNALKAADAVADRIAPRKVADARPQIVIHIDLDERRRLEQVQLEAGRTIDVTPERVDGAHPEDE